MDKQQTFRLMISLQITQAEVYFSGGNDEGGVDSIMVSKGNGRTIDLPVIYEGSELEWNQETKKWEAKQKKSLTPEEQLSILLQQPVYDEYESFAGDFHVDGVVYWDASAKTVRMEKDEEVSHSEHRSYDL